MSDWEPELLAILHGPTADVLRRVEALCHRHPHQASEIRALAEAAQGSSSPSADAAPPREPTGPTGTLRPDSLPQGVSEQVLRILDGPTEAWEGALEQVCRVHPEHSQAIRAMADAGVFGTDHGLPGFRILEKLGKGGFGTVYLAEQTNPRQKVAIKVINPGMDTREVLARFAAERQALALMNHPYIAKVLGAGETERGRPYFVMEYVPGLPIHEYCQRHKLPVRQRVALMIQVCDGVHHAHQKAILHRDLTARNVLVTEVDGKPQPKLIDFGIAKSLAGRLTEESLHTVQNQVFGTPEFMSPEQAQSSGHNIDIRSDVYSLGVILYVMLTGTLPIPASELRECGPRERAERIRDLEPTIPSRRIEDPATARAVRGELDWITMKAMAKEREQRYGTAAEFAQDLRRSLEQEAVLAGPPTTRYRMGKFVRRYRGRLAVAAAILLSLIGGLTVALYQRGVAQASYAGFQRLADLVSVERLEHEWQQSVQITSAGAAGLQRWLADVAPVFARLTEHEAALAQVQARATRIAGNLQWLSTEDQFLGESQARLVAALQRWRDEDFIGRGRAAFAWATTRRERTIVAEAPRWQAAAQRIAGDPRYQGLTLSPQEGLVPLGVDPTSGLWEFALMQPDIEPPVRGPDGRLELADDIPVVLVLIPAGTFLLGARRAPDQPGYDPYAERNEAPPAQRSVAPFFLAKHEMSLRQWERLTGASPRTRKPKHEPLDPVTFVSWDEAAAGLARHGLRLPSEVEWEYACRAKTTTPWSCARAEDDDELPRHMNSLDQAAQERGAPGPVFDAFLDHYAGPAPIGTFLPNQFGLHDMHGNVWEWCEETYAPYPGSTATTPPEPERVLRGGSFLRRAVDARSSKRSSLPPHEQRDNVGLRAARSVEPGR